MSPMLEALTCTAVSYYGSVMRFRHAGAFSHAEVAYALRVQSYPLLMVGDLLRYWWNNEDGSMPITIEEDWTEWRRAWGI
ncbi:MAG: hypothetical protein E6Q97_12405 [Desulfurellales bacterium]|nr:MAG: hypothetical protein E6Q97_12405 [Desulfurellales bacterium]